MEINPYKDIFKMYGNYNIREGRLPVYLQGVINKNSRLKMAAIYHVKAIR
jgi:hypothetical protein